MPDIDSTVDIKITSGQGMVTVAIPLAGQASEDWLKGFHVLAAPLGRGAQPEAEQREDRTWVIVKLPTRTPVDPESALDAVSSALDAVSAVISKANSADQEDQAAAARTEAAIRDWWARQQR
jgi:hypothetical protein